MAKPYPREFRDDVVAVARKGQAPLSQIAKDFGISAGSLTNWLKQADIEDGRRPGLTDADRAELRDARKRIRLLEQENEVLPRAAAYLSQAYLPGNSLPARPRDGRGRHPDPGTGRGGVQGPGAEPTGVSQVVAVTGV